MSANELPPDQFTRIRRVVNSGGDSGSRPKPRRRSDPKYLTEGEISRFFDAIQSPRDAALFRLIYHRGLRASEAGLLYMSDYDPRGKRITVTRKKGSYGGTFALYGSEGKALTKWLQARGTEPGPLFPGYRGRGIGRHAVGLLMKQYCLSAGIPPAKAHPHALKHSCATHLLEKLGNVTTVQELIGHVDVRSTMVYARVTERAKDLAAAKLKDW